jgi:hypothetical protein
MSTTINVSLGVWLENFRRTRNYDYRLALVNGKVCYYVNMCAGKATMAHWDLRNRTQKIVGRNCETRSCWILRTPASIKNNFLLQFRMNHCELRTIAPFFPRYCAALLDGIGEFFDAFSEVQSVNMTWSDVSYNVSSHLPFWPAQNTNK